ncbi:dUTPase [Lysinibacillus yapensis]|uniref:dUTPase n=1 Tax=Ureibacillus yapensis TaxID=2304605 RepID=A0A396SCH4_9BACL|nr:dUTP diphosphatase [Lysinibacillus yapensis]RHW38720.1 dUTPase [Lysinibacillus yapensis]
MNYQKLFKAQAALDAHIIGEKNLEGQDLFTNKVEALLCEIQETANETRCFKHWSNKGPEMDKALEETADSFHFVLSLGNDLGIDPEQVAKQPARVYKDLTEQFIALSYAAVCIAMFNERQLYYFETISLFKGLVNLLGFTEEQLEEAYYDKNKVNHERQATNY